MRRFYTNQTLTTNGADDVIMGGGVNLTVNFPQPYPQTFYLASSGSNTATFNGPIMSGYNATLTVFDGRLTFNAGMYADAHVRAAGNGQLKANATIGGSRYGASDMSVGLHDQGSNYVVLSNGSLAFDRMTFLQEAASVTLNDLGMPVDNMGGHVPELVLKGLGDLRDVVFSQQNGLHLDFANPALRDVNYGGLHITDAGMYSAIQEADGDLVIKPTATWAQPASSGGSPFAYAAPTAGSGEEVFKLTA